MRITGGTARGHKLMGPRPGNKSLRPTTDRVREAVFSILGKKVTEARVLDLFAGTGSYGLEALSRRAKSVVFVERDRTALEILAQNLIKCFPDSSARAFQLDLSQTSSLDYLKKHLPNDFLFDLVFLDPPYEKRLAKNLLKMIDFAGFIVCNGTIIVEEKKNQQFPEKFNRLQLIDRRNYGEIGIWMYTSRLSE